MHDGVLALNLPNKVSSDGFADDTEMAIVAKCLEMIKISPNVVVAEIIVIRKGRKLRMA